LQFFMETNTITWAAIGCGSVCEVKSLPAMYKLPGSKVAGVFARNTAKATDFAQRHAIPKVYPTVQHLLADDDVDIVYIATPPDSHKAYTVAALDAGKHVYVEKPMGLNYAECLEMQRHAEMRNRKLFVAHYRRALPYFLQVKNLLQQGSIGKIITARWELYQPPYAKDRESTLPWRLEGSVAGGGYFFDLAPHGIDILQFLLNDDIADAHGFATNRGGLYAVEDGVAASFITHQGIAGTLQLSFVTTAAAKTDRLIFLGTEGELTCSVFAFTPILLCQNGLTQAFEAPKPQHIQMPLVETILQELRGNGKCPSHAIDALPTVMAMDKMVGRIVC
jgi:predicted dehydrogenase